MNSLLPLATESIAGHLQFLANLRYQTVGVMIVMTSLCGLAVLVALVAKGISFFPTTKKSLAPEAPKAPVPPATPAAALADGIPAEIRAVIAAAIHVSLKSPHRILHVEPVQNPQLHAWSVEGRRQIFQSHTFR